jgi:hypothetical protein
LRCDLNEELGIKTEEETSRPDHRPNLSLSSLSFSFSFSSVIPAADFEFPALTKEKDKE